MYELKSGCSICTIIQNTPRNTKQLGRCFRKSEKISFQFARIEIFLTTPPSRQTIKLRRFHLILHIQKTLKVVSELLFCFHTYMNTNMNTNKSSRKARKATKNLDSAPHSSCTNRDFFDNAPSGLKNQTNKVPSPSPFPIDTFKLFQRLVSFLPPLLHLT